MQIFNRTLIEKEKIERIAMYTIIKKVFKTTIFLFAIIIISGIGMFFYQAIRNYFGYCSENGINLTTQERLNIAITKYLSEQNQADIHEIAQAKIKEKPEYNDKSKAENDFELIYYKNAEEFLRENPDCCDLTRDSGEGDQFGFWEMADGAGNGMFDFKHKIRYRNQDGQINEIISNKTYYSVFNCGYPRRHSYY